MLGLLFVVAISLQLMWEWLGGCNPVSHAGSEAPTSIPFGPGDFGPGRNHSANWGHSDWQLYKNLMGQRSKGARGSRGRLTADPARVSGQPQEAERGA